MPRYTVGAVVQLVEYRTRNLEQVANLLCAQANSAGWEMSSSYGYGVKA